MSEVRKMLLSLLFLVIPAAGAVDVSLSGNVLDENGTAICGAVVKLASDSALRDTTDTNGTFVLSNGTAIRMRHSSENIRLNSDRVDVMGNRLVFTLESDANCVTVVFFTGDGKKFAEIKPGKMTSGVHSYKLPPFTANLYAVQITIDGYSTYRRLINTGGGLLLGGTMNEIAGSKTGTERKVHGVTTEVLDTIIVSKNGFSIKKEPVSAYKKSDIKIVLQKQPVYNYAASVENTCRECSVSVLTDAKSLTVKNSKLPDPFKKIDGTRITKKSEWPCRRQEILKQAEKYIYGEKPLDPDSVIGTVTSTKVTVHVSDSGKSIDFSAQIVLPSKGTGPFPAIINVGAKGGFGGIVLGESRMLDMGVAVIYYNNYDLGVEGTAEQSRGKANPGKFYDIYGGKHSAGLLMAWAWGVSRMIDVLQKEGGNIIDASRLAVTGCSRSGKGAFAIGLFDERIALTIPQETSTAGVPAYRIVDVLGRETTKNNYYGLNWLSNNFEPFVLNTSILPIDAHELVASFAPRGLLVLENPSATQMGAPAGNMSVAGGAEVYKALGAEDNVNYCSNTPNGTSHCSYVNEYTDPLTKCVAKFLKHETAQTGKIVAGANGTVSRASWIDWTAPALADDTDLYKTE